MRTDVKVGILVGVLIVTGAIIYVATRDNNSAPGTEDTKTIEPSKPSPDPDGPKPIVNSQPPVNPKPVEPKPEITPKPEPQPEPEPKPEPQPEPLVTPEPVVKPVVPVKTEPVNTEPWYYVVKRGDSLYQIAEQYYGEGNGRYWKVIYDANKQVIGEADRLEVGWILNIPRPEDVASKLD